MSRETLRIRLVLNPFSSAAARRLRGWLVRQFVACKAILLLGAPSKYVGPACCQANRAFPSHELPGGRAPR